MRHKYVNFNLQFFASDPEPDTPDNDDSEQEVEDPEGIQEPEKEKTFSQDEMRRVAAREKRQGRQAVLNSLGVKSEADLKKIVDAYNRFMQADSPEEKKKIQGNSDMEQLERRALLAESKVAALAMGVNKDSVDDAIAIAMMKAQVSGDEVSDVLEDMKKDKAYAGFFAAAQEPEPERGKGTGTGVGTRGAGAAQTAADFGKALAKGNKQQTKSNFFRWT